MKKSILSLLLTVSVSITACTKSESANSESSSKNAIEGKTASCLLAYKDRLNSLLPLEKAAAVAGKSKDEAKQNYNRVMKNSDYHSMQYSWKSGRKKMMSILGSERLLPVNDLVELHGMKEVTLDYFKNSHRAPTEEQLAASQKQLDKAIDGKSDNAKVNAEVKKLDEMKLSKETQKSTAGSLNSVFAEVARSYSDVPGLGQAAAWNSFENRLYIFDKGVELAVTVDVSSDGEVNKKKAIELGEALLDCK